MVYFTRFNITNDISIINLLLFIFGERKKQLSFSCKYIC